MKIKVRLLAGQELPTIIKKGDWIDLRASEDVKLSGPYANTLSSNRTKRDVVADSTLISLGIAMELPKGFEANVVARSSTFKKFGVIQANAFGIIDQSYCGNDDIWKFPAIAFRDTIIKKGDRICQFRLQLSQFATPWQKIKWLFTSKIEFVQVNNLGHENRYGFGSTN